LLLSHAIFVISVLFSLLKASAAPARTLPSLSSTAVRLTLSTRIGKISSRRIRAPLTRFTSTILFTNLCFSSSRHAILTRCGLLGSLVTGRHRYDASSRSPRTPDSTTIRITASKTWSLPSSTREVSIMQWSVSVSLEGAELRDVRVCTLLSWLIGGVRATSAYNCLGLL